MRTPPRGWGGPAYQRQRERCLSGSSPTIGQVYAKGDAQTIHCAGPAHLRQRQDVRLAAVTAIRQVAEENDLGAIRLLQASLCHTSLTISQTAALITLLEARLTSESERVVRLAAAITIQPVSVTGDAQTSAWLGGPGLPATAREMSIWQQSYHRASVCEGRCADHSMRRPGSPATAARCQSGRSDCHRTGGREE